MAAPLPLADFDPSLVVQTFGTIVPLAYGPDSRITITPSASRYTVMQGQDGHIIRVKVRAVYHTASFSLMRSDPANELLGSLLQDDIDDEANSGKGILKYQLTDNNGSEKVTAPYAWVEREPDVAFSAAGDLRVWSVVLAYAKIQVGTLKPL